MSPATSPFDHLSLDSIAGKAHKALDNSIKTDMPNMESVYEREAAFWLDLLQARATLEAAEAQRHQTFWLVLVTGLLVLATIALVLVTLYVRPEIIVEVAQP